ncbi:MAG: gephyrin-like molybdotransferase Glp [Rhodothalassiaceae bacterium]
MTGLMPLDEAHARLIAALRPCAPETVPLADAAGRVLAEPVQARRTQPPADLSAMDGYAVRAADARAGAKLTLVDTIYAGQMPDAPLQPGQTARLFTGSPLPAGADAVLIQEQAEAAEDRVHVHADVAPGQHVRRAGSDFFDRAELIAAGTRLSPFHLSLAAAGDCAGLCVHRRPTVMLFSTGDELVAPGMPRRPGQIVDAVAPGLTALAAQAGARPHHLGIFPDDPAALEGLMPGLSGADMIVSVGGASVGDKDLIRTALPGLTLDFWRLAMRPGKPLLFGRLNGVPFLGLPGNPVSALVCAWLLLMPALRRLGGQDGAMTTPTDLPLAQAIPANGSRRDFQRAQIIGGRVKPFAVQDSAMLTPLAAADALLMRPERDGARTAGENVPVFPLKWT